MRDSKIDSAKFILVALVTLGHLIEPLHAGPFDYTYRFIYLFHMPAFVFLSGLVSASYVDADRAHRLVGAVVIPLAVHQAGLQLLDSVLNGTSFLLLPYRPNWALWYLMSLVCWRLMLPLVMATRFPLATVLFLALAAGFFNRIGYDWSISRTLVFMPFFVAGHQWALKKGRSLPAFPSKVTVIGAIEIAVLAWLALRISRHWFYGSLSYEALGVSDAYGIAYRGSLIAIGFVGAICFLSLVPGTSLLARLGRHSMAAFILHIYAVKILYAAGVVALLSALPPVAGVAAAALISIAVTTCGALAGQVFPYAFDFSLAMKRRRVSDTPAAGSP